MDFHEDGDGNLVIDNIQRDDFARLIGVTAWRPPRHLYKFSTISPNLLDSLSNGYLWYSRYLDFNDPFDCKIAIDYALDAAGLADHVKLDPSMQVDLGKRAVWKLDAPVDTEYSYLSKYAIESRYLAPLSHKSLNLLLSAAKLAERTVALNDLVGVCCLTKDPVNILMWSHYAAQHSGICLKFRCAGSTSGFQDSCLPVTYSPRVLTPVWQEGDLQQQARIILRGLLRKSTHWSNEQEWRSVVLGGYGRQEFDRADLVEVTLGVNTSPKDAANVREALADPTYAHVAVKRARIHYNKYRISILDEDDD